MTYIYTAERTTSDEMGFSRPTARYSYEALSSTTAVLHADCMSIINQPLTIQDAKKLSIQNQFTGPGATTCCLMYRYLLQLDLTRSSPCTGSCSTQLQAVTQEVCHFLAPQLERHMAGSECNTICITASA